MRFLSIVSSTTVSHASIWGNIENIFEEKADHIEKVIKNVSDNTEMQQNLLTITISKPVPALPDCFEDDVDYFGDDIKRARNIPDATTCQKKCQETRGCRYWTWTSKGFFLRNRCFMKDGQGTKKKKGGAISGPRECHSLFRCVPTYQNSKNTIDHCKNRSRELCNSGCTGKFTFLATIKSSIDTTSRVIELKTTAR